MDNSTLIQLFSIHYHYRNGKYNDDIYSHEYNNYVKTNMYPNIIDDVQLEITHYYLENIFKYLISDDKTAGDIYDILMSMDIEAINSFIHYFENIFSKKDTFIRMMKKIYFSSSKMPVDIVEKCNLFFEKINLYKENNVIDIYLYKTDDNLIIDLFGILDKTSDTEEYITKIIRDNITHFYIVAIYDYFRTYKSVDDIYRMTMVMDKNIVEMILYIFNSSQNKFEDYIRWLYNEHNIDNIDYICLKASVFFQKILIRFIHNGQ
jgi:hypothetical protein